MRVAERAFRAWHRLAPKWGKYLQQAGLDLSGASLADFSDLLLATISIDFRQPGLEDFCRSSCRGIEPGDPARSLLYHVMASPGFVRPELNDTDYPSAEEIQAIEDYVYGIVPPSLDDLRVRAESGPLATVVFAYEYSPAADTVHRYHADLCFSRTGISRIGNSTQRYVRKFRGYVPFSDDQTAVHVVPCRFGAFLATQRKGNPRTIGPERFRDGDADRNFWVPLHKLFDGPDCIDGFDLKVTFSAHHVNEKIRRIHLALQHEGNAIGWSAAELNDPPFRITEGIANLGNEDERDVVIPVLHRPLIDVARTREGAIVSFRVPKNHPIADGALLFAGQQNAQPSPELVHAKHALAGGKVTSLLACESKSINEIIQDGAYDAVNFVDYTGDGWVEANCIALTPYVPTRLAAYSLVAQPDFFPLVKQKSLMEWWENSAPPEIKDNLWPYQLTPFPLMDERMPVNITLTGAGFDSTDDTMTAIVGVSRAARPPGRIRPFLVERESTLAFRASGLFFPGWDCSRDFGRDDRSPQGVLHLAHYGIGSPFAEDSMICAAHGSFWPAAAPDTTRFFPPSQYPSVTPLLDSEAGWDGVPLPQEKERQVEFRTLVYTDYVELATNSRLAFGHFAQITLDEYVARTLAMARVFQVLGANDIASRLSWSVLEFERASPDDLASIGPQKENFDNDRTFRLRLTRIEGASPARKPFDVTVGKASGHDLFFSCGSAVAHRRAGHGSWEFHEF
jgi:hypothetical protein